jgi:hypothetical protein
LSIVGFLVLTVITLGFFANFSCSAKSRVRVVWLSAIPDKNLAVPAVIFFGSKGETNLGTENFFFGRSVPPVFVQDLWVVEKVEN